MIELVITPICLLVDQYTKNRAEKSLKDSKRKQIFKNKIHLQVVYNKGAFLGFLRRHRQLLMLANILSIGVLAFAIGELFFIKGYHLVKTGISFMAGGAMGNIYDRIKKGKVVDFFAFSIKPKIFFNLADIFVFFGALLVFIGSIFVEGRN